jgi:hypothetical protein
MENLDIALVQWVFFKQLNENNLSRKCENLTDLSDGILLFELLGSM